MDTATFLGFTKGYEPGISSANGINTVSNIQHIKQHVQRT